jgi:Ca2+-transporting ATPase
VTDGLPALALGVERAERSVMRRPPRSPRESLIGRGMGIHVIWVGILMAGTSLFIGWWYWRQPENSIEHGLWQTMLFNVLTLAQMAHAMAIRSERDSLFTIGIFSNRRMVQAVSITFLLQIAVTYVPFLQSTFNTVSLPPFEFVLCGVLASIIFWAVECEKWTSRRRSQQSE